MRPQLGVFVAGRGGIGSLGVFICCMLLAANLVLELGVVIFANLWVLMLLLAVHAAHMLLAKGS
jgi:hypothetical protein